MNILEGGIVAPRIIVLSIQVLLLEPLKKPQIIIRAVWTPRSMIAFSTLKVTLDISKFVLLLLLN